MKDTVRWQDDTRGTQSCIDGSLHVKRVIRAFMPINFANSLYKTELHIVVPLPFFLNKNLCALIDEASTLLLDLGHVILVLICRQVHIW